MMKRMIVTVTLAVVGLVTAGPAIAQQRSQSPVAVHGQRQAQTQSAAARPVYQRGDTEAGFGQMQRGNGTVITKL